MLSEIYGYCYLYTAHQKGLIDTPPLWRLGYSYGQTPNKTAVDSENTVIIECRVHLPHHTHGRLKEALYRLSESRGYRIHQKTIDQLKEYRTDESLCEIEEVFKNALDTRRSSTKKRPRLSIR